MTTTYRNLITGEPAQAQPYRRNYFELEVVSQTNGYLFGTSQGDNLCAYATANTFGNAWVDALTHTVIGGSAYVALQEMQAQPRPVDPGTEPDSPVYSGSFDVTQSNDDGPADDEGFDPYAGNLDTLLGY